MSSRTYLSIGDVLTLLREEFPDVTISKIRFLESQGLVNPERSPSGYRKFFEHDVERLRWVLRQQREYFLPLKVIRDRLAEGNMEGGPMQASEASAVAADPGANGNASDSHALSGPGVQNGAVDEPLTKADSEAMARILADASRRAALLDETHAPMQGAASSTGSAAAAASSSSPAAAPSGRHLAAPDRSAAAPRDASVAEPRHAAAPSHATAARTAAPSRTAQIRNPSSGGVDAVAEAVATAGRGGRSADAEQRPNSPAKKSDIAAAPSGATKSGAARTAGSAKSTSGAGMVTGASLTAEELCSASGLSEIELAGLQGFGLIEAINVAGMQTFDEDALTVANLAAELRGFGIEPRHLRLYRNAVDRELGLIEQVIIPLLRQRNPESRQRAVDSAEQLGALGQAMRTTLLRSALRRHLGG